MDSFVRRWMGRAEKGKHIFRSRQLTIHKIFIRNKTTVYGQSTIFYVYESLTWCVSGGRIFFTFASSFPRFFFYSSCRLSCGWDIVWYWWPVFSFSLCIYYLDDGQYVMTAHNVHSIRFSWTRPDYT